MARRRRRRTLRRPLLVAALALAALAAGIWLLRKPAPPPPPGSPEGPRSGRPEGAPPSKPRRAPTRVVSPAGPGPTARVAIVLDDLGRRLEEADRLLALRIPVTAAVLPFEPRSREVAGRLLAGGAELLVHLPMEPMGGENPGPNAVLEGQGRRRVERLTGRAIDALPGAVGLNNHMGSRVSAEPRAVAAILDVVAARGLYFLDSRTTADSLAFDAARERGVPATRRDVFLDSDPSPEAVRSEFHRLLELARERGAAVGIGHPHDVTFEILEAEIPAARALGVEFVPISFLLERSESLPE